MNVKLEQMTMEDNFFSLNRSPSASIDSEGHLCAAYTLELMQNVRPVYTFWNDDEKQEKTIEISGQCQQINTFSGIRGVGLVWNEYDSFKKHWSINVANVFYDNNDNSSNVETVRESMGPCLHPQGCATKDFLCIVWSEKRNDFFQIWTSFSLPHSWSEPKVLSPENCDAFRPTVYFIHDRLFIFWDQYSEGNYSIHGACIRNSRIENRFNFYEKECNWIQPELTAGNDSVFLSWISSGTVEDNKTIVDHEVFGIGAMLNINDDNFSSLVFPDEKGENHIADLRNGLLVADQESHQNYSGLRRNLRLINVENKGLYCLYERRFSERSGCLIARKYHLSNKQWGSETVIHNGGSNYALPAKSSESVVQFAFIVDGNHVEFAKINFEDTTFEPLSDNNKHWYRWKPTRMKREKISGEVTTQKGRLKLFWSDTHCHSAFSPDVEGEVDELIHFARDVAKLDAVCISDNDYYPHKSLNTSEWQILQFLSNHYTEPGRFLAFPGFEYTNWDKPENHINHRIVLYAEGGPLYRHIDPETSTIEKLYDRLAQDKLNPLCYPHHTTYKLENSNYERLVEICSSWRVCMEECDFSVNQLKSGHRFGFMGSSDTHRAVPGLGGTMTGVFAESLERKSVFSSYMNRHTIVTQGFFCFIDFKINDSFIGEECEISNHPPILQTSIIAPRKICHVEIFRDGKTIKQFSPNKPTWEKEYSDLTVKNGPHFYFLRVRLDGEPGFNMAPELNGNNPFTTSGEYPHNLSRSQGCYAWTSPIWLNLSI